MAKTLSGEEHKVLVEHSKTHRDPAQLFKPVVLVAAALIIAGLSFTLGIQYQKDHAKKIASTNTTSQSGNGNGQLGPNSQNGLGGGRRRFGGQRPVLGQVTAIDASSITIKDQNSTTTTFTITDTTTVTDNGQSSALANVKVGDNVAIVASPTDAKQAARILLNPSFGGNPAAGSTNTPAPSSIN